MAEPQIAQSIFPDLPREIPAVNTDGNFNSLWALGFSSLFQALQRNFKNEGIVFPPLTASQQATIQAIYTPLIGMPLPSDIPDISGQTIFDSTNRLCKQFVITYDNSTPQNILAAQWNILSYLVIGSGNPNGSQAAQAGWLYFDIIGHSLYICITSGSTTSALWIAI